MNLVSKYFFTKRKLFFAIMLVFGSLLLFIGIYNHYVFRTFAFDYGVYNFAWYNYSHFQISNCPIYTVFGVQRNFLQDHFSLTFFILTPFYWLMSFATQTYSIILIQWMFVMIGAYATFKLIQIKSQNYWLSLFSLIYYFVIYGRYSSFQNDCNLAIIGASVLPIFFYFFETNNKIATLISFAFLILNREDFSLCLIFVCLFLAINYRKQIKVRNFALLLSFISALSFLIIYYVFIPAIHSKEVEFRLFDYTALGESPLQAITFILSHPIKSFQYLFINHSSDSNLDGIKAKFYLVYGLSGGLLLFLKPQTFILLIPFLAKKMYNDSADRWSCETYYSIEIASLLPILVFSILSELKTKNYKNYYASIICMSAAVVTVYCMFAAVYPNAFLKFNVLDRKYFQTDLNVKNLHFAFTQIPNDASVSASTRLVPHFSLRKKIYHFPVVEDADYICVQTKRDTYPYTLQKFNDTIIQIFKTGKWKVLDGDGEYLVLKKMNYK